MKQTRISQEPLFLHFVPIEGRFVPFQHSIVWQYNNLFWKYHKLWQKTYNEDYEHSLPSTIPFSHKPSFITKSAKQFFDHLKKLHETNRLPERIIVIEQGPGSGVYAKGFLERIHTWSTKQYPFYERIRYVLSDTAAGVLTTCKETLKAHLSHIELFHQPSDRAIPKHYAHQALLVRHGNMWDQFPAQMLRISSHGIGQVYTRAVVDGSFEKYLKDIPYTGPLSDFAKSLRNGKFENLITTYPQLWKPFLQRLRLETTLRQLSPFTFQKLPYKTSLQTIARECQTDEQVLFSKAVLDNVSDMTHLIDWKRGGYIEVVDIMARSFSHLRRKRVPQKFDGAIAVFINAPLIKDYMRRRGKHVGLKKLKYLNTVATVTDYHLKTVLENKQFVTMAEIAAKQNETKQKLIKKAEKLLDMQIDFVTFSDRAHGWTDFVPVEQLLQMGIYDKLQPQTLLQVFATRRKTEEQIQTLISKLKQKGIENLFVVTGDKGEHDVSNITSLAALPILSPHFFTGSVAKPDITDIPKTLEKIQKGAQFFIVQSTYDHKAWEIWVKEIKRKKLHKKVHFIQSLIPVVTKKTIAAMQAFPDVPVAKDIVEQFEALPEQQVAAAGRTLAKQLVKTYKEAGVFSGVYIFSRSFRVIGDMVDVVNS